MNAYLVDILTHGTVYALTGAFAGLMAGLIGIGGGMVVVPGLLYVFAHHNLMPQDVLMHFAAGTSLAIMIITAQSAVRAHYRLGDIYWPAFNRLWPGIVLGTICGAALAKQIPTYWLQRIFAVFLLLISVKMLSDVKVTKIRDFPRPWINNLVSYVIGFKSGLLGIGGGALIIPYLTYCGIDMRKITPVSSLCTITVSTIGTLAFIILGWGVAGEPRLATGFVYWPAVLWVSIPAALLAPIGARLTYALPVKKLKYGFIAFLIITAIDMLY